MFEHEILAFQLLSLKIQIVSIEDDYHRSSHLSHNIMEMRSIFETFQMVILAIVFVFFGCLLNWLL